MDSPWRIAQWSCKPVIKTDLARLWKCSYRIAIPRGRVGVINAFLCLPVPFPPLLDMQRTTRSGEVTLKSGIGAQRICG